MEHHQDHEFAYWEPLPQKVALGDQLAFRELYHTFHKRLHYFAFAPVKTKEAAEEIVEDVFIRLWNQRATITRDQQPEDLPLHGHQEYSFELFEPQSAGKHYRTL